MNHGLVGVVLYLEERKSAASQAIFYHRSQTGSSHCPSCVSHLLGVSLCRSLDSPTHFLSRKEVNLHIAVDMWFAEYASLVLSGLHSPWRPLRNPPDDTRNLAYFPTSQDIFH